jgi:hypothetical protein
MDNPHYGSTYPHNQVTKVEFSPDFSHRAVTHAYGEWMAPGCGSTNASRCRPTSLLIRRGRPPNFTIRPGAATHLQFWCGRTITNREHLFLANSKSWPILKLTGKPQCRATPAHQWTSTTCARGCGHNAAVDVSALPGDLAVRDAWLRLRCSKCGNRPTETRPDWTEYRAKGKMEFRRK